MHRSGVAEFRSTGAHAVAAINHPQLIAKVRIYVRLRKALLENWWVPASVPAHLLKQIKQFCPAATPGTTVPYIGQVVQKVRNYATYYNSSELQ
ncbi:hypothetical protein [Desulfomonile tiedjei]|uniref:Uncharacterized protein n=1 Tax=Desulfomonile tiedjei (strain ATCC 49306 / DSM 6799 / DCB-1) TaxID=706587 RepID=I4C7G5_DESTA|nr:hypothetical protein [Desulfomonile tiedjei]AFM25506.1 hypothetical protein Desti_2836 [Desulfomonile tiedjei DSM 6799]